ncbi:hypothetical protein [Chondromyces apiculatus]|uniref:Uncharacterized protein n=1 Tax=Chondromyces apiculatus DSM 436 TaxID=1192034 RepID=A0A017TCS7_9BACT|nr:hypothetical protein [Chondromyces apiculatus]EYF07068.1 Hypothetical protein CAP_1327 [Chondromyces apiculatus DSM 436]
MNADDEEEVAVKVARLEHAIPAGEATKQEKLRTVQLAVLSIVVSSCAALMAFVTELAGPLVSLVFVLGSVQVWTAVFRPRRR